MTHTTQDPAVSATQDPHHTATTPDAFSETEVATTNRVQRRLSTTAPPTSLSSNPTTRLVASDMHRKPPPAGAAPSSPDGSSNQHNDVSDPRPNVGGLRANVRTGSVGDGRSRGAAVPLVSLYPDAALASPAASAYTAGPSSAGSDSSRSSAASAFTLAHAEVVSRHLFSALGVANATGPSSPSHDYRTGSSPQPLSPHDAVAEALLRNGESYDVADSFADVYPSRRNGARRSSSTRSSVRSPTEAITDHNTTPNHDYTAQTNPISPSTYYDPDSIRLSTSSRARLSATGASTQLSDTKEFTLGSADSSLDSSCVSPSVLADNTVEKTTTSPDNLQRYSSTPLTADANNITPSSAVTTTANQRDDTHRKRAHQFHSVPILTMGVSLADTHSDSAHSRSQSRSQSRSRTPLQIGQPTQSHFLSPNTAVSHSKWSASHFGEGSATGSGGFASPNGTRAAPNAYNLLNDDALLLSDAASFEDSRNGIGSRGLGIDGFNNAEDINEDSYPNDELVDLDSSGQQSQGQTDGLTRKVSSSSRRSYQQHQKNSIDTSLHQRHQSSSSQSPLLQDIAAVPGRVINTISTAGRELTAKISQKMNLRSPDSDGLDSSSTGDSPFIEGRIVVIESLRTDGQDGSALRSPRRHSNVSWYEGDSGRCNYEHSQSRSGSRRNSFAGKLSLRSPSPNSAQFRSPIPGSVIMSPRDMSVHNEIIDKDEEAIFNKLDQEQGVNGGDVDLIPAGDNNSIIVSPQERKVNVTVTVGTPMRIPTHTTGPLLHSTAARTVSSFAGLARYSLRLTNTVTDSFLRLVGNTTAASIRLGRQSLVQSILSTRNAQVLAISGITSVGSKLINTPVKAVSLVKYPFTKRNTVEDEMRKKVQARDRVSSLGMIIPSYTHLLDSYTTASIYVVYNAFSIADLISSSAIRAIADASKVSIETTAELIQIVDGLFGNTETSKALAACFSVVGSELFGLGYQNDMSRPGNLSIIGKDGKPPGRFTATRLVLKALMAYTCLQYFNTVRWDSKLAPEIIPSELLFQRRMIASGTQGFVFSGTELRDTKTVDELSERLGSRSRVSFKGDSTGNQLVDGSRSSVASEDDESRILLLIFDAYVESNGLLLSGGYCDPVPQNYEFSEEDLGDSNSTHQSDGVDGDVSVAEVTDSERFDSSTNDLLPTEDTELGLTSDDLATAKEGSSLSRSESFTEKKGEIKPALDKLSSYISQSSLSHISRSPDDMIEFPSSLPSSKSVTALSCFQTQEKLPQQKYIDSSTVSIISTADNKSNSMVNSLSSLTGTPLMRRKVMSKSSGLLPQFLSKSINRFTKKINKAARADFLNDSTGLDGMVSKEFSGADKTLKDEVLGKFKKRNVRSATNKGRARTHSRGDLSALRLSTISSPSSPVLTTLDDAAIASDKALRRRNTITGAPNELSQRRPSSVMITHNKDGSRVRTSSENAKLFFLDNDDTEEPYSATVLSPPRPSPQTYSLIDTLLYDEMDDDFTSIKHGSFSSSMTSTQPTRTKNPSYTQSAWNYHSRHESTPATSSYNYLTGFGNSPLTKRRSSITEGLPVAVKPQPVRELAKPQVVASLVAARSLLSGSDNENSLEFSSEEGESRLSSVSDVRDRLAPFRVLEPASLQLSAGVTEDGLTLNPEEAQTGAISAVDTALPRSGSLTRSRVFTLPTWRNEIESLISDGSIMKPSKSSSFISGLANGIPSAPSSGKARYGPKKVGIQVNTSFGKQAPLSASILSSRTTLPYFSSQAHKKSLSAYTERAPRTGGLSPIDDKMPSSEFDTDSSTDDVTPLVLDNQKKVDESPERPQTPLKSAISKEALNEESDIEDSEKQKTNAGDMIIRAPSSKNQTSADDVFITNNYFRRKRWILFQSLARFAKFASGAYGTNFLKILGVSPQKNAVTVPVGVKPLATGGGDNVNDWAVGKDVVGLDDRNEMNFSHHNHETFANHTKLPVEHVLYSTYDAALSLNEPTMTAPVYYICVDTLTSSVVLTLRGTLGLSDLITDISSSYVYYVFRNGLEGKIHSGMLDSAERICNSESIKDSLIQALERHPGFKLVLVGHSLGGGVASLLGMLWTVRVLNEDGEYNFVLNPELGFPEGRRVLSFGYGSPGTVSVDLAYDMRNLSSSVVYRDDFIPWLSMGIIRDMRRMTVNLCNDEELADAIIRKTMGSAMPDFLADLLWGKQSDRIPGSKPVPESEADKQGKSWFRWWRNFSHTESKATPSNKESSSNNTEKTENADDDADIWFWKLLTKVRTNQRSEKLFPPGRIYWMDARDESFASCVRKERQEKRKKRTSTGKSKNAKNSLKKTDKATTSATGKETTEPSVIAIPNEVGESVKPVSQPASSSTRMSSWWPMSLAASTVRYAVDGAAPILSRVVPTMIQNTVGPRIRRMVGEESCVSGEDSSGETHSSWPSGGDIQEEGDEYEDEHEEEEEEEEEEEDGEENDDKSSDEGKAIILRESTRVRIHEVMDVERCLSEFIFTKSMFMDHSPILYEKSLSRLVIAASQVPTPTR